MKTIDCDDLNTESIHEFTRKVDSLIVTAGSLPELYRKLNTLQSNGRGGQYSWQLLRHPTWRDGRLIAVLLRRDRLERPIEHMESTIRGEHDESIGTIKTFRDITARKAIDAERDALLKREQIARAAAALGHLQHHGRQLTARGQPCDFRRHLGSAVAADSGFRVWKTKFATIGERRHNQAQMWELIGEYALKHDKREFMAILNELDVPCGPIMSTQDLANDEHVRGRDMWVELDHPQRGKWWNVGMPIKLSASPAVIERSPLLGEHTDEVLKDVLGYDEAKIGAMKQAGAFSAPPKKK